MWTRRPVAVVRLGHVAAAAAAAALVAGVAVRRRRRRLRPLPAERPATLVRVDHAPIVPQDLVDEVADDRAGGVAVFAGVTRDNFDGKAVTRLEYEGYATMAEAELLRLVAAARATWPDLLRVSVRHRLGLCPVGETSVAIAVSAPHRRACLEACADIIDRLKEAVPIWKKECYADAAAADLWKRNAEARGATGDEL